MWFRKISAGAFGHLLHESLKFGRALNVVYGPNESGKSTWHAALLVGLCGHRHGSGRTNLERDFKKRRQPWDDPDRWHVTLEVALDDGRNIEIERDLNAPSTRILDLGMGGREVPDDLMNHGSPDGAKWVGLDRTTFPLTASISQADILSMLNLKRREYEGERNALQESLARATAGGAGGTAAGAIERIRRFSAENIGLDRRNVRRPLRLAIDGVKRAQCELSKTEDRRREYVDLARRVDRNRRDVQDLEARREAIKSLIAKEEAEARASQLEERATKLEEWERRFHEGDPWDQAEVSTSDLVIAINVARNAPESVETDLDPLEVLESRLGEVDRQRHLIEASERLQQAEMQAEELKRYVQRLEKWEQRFLGADPSHRELTSFTDIASAIARCNSLPTPGVTDINPLAVLEERMVMIEDSSPKPCPSPGDVQRWVIPLRETPPPPRLELESKLAEAQRQEAPYKKPWSRSTRTTVSAVIGVTAAGAVWMVTAEPLYGALTGVLVALGLMFLRADSFKQEHMATVDIESVERQLREREDFDARVAEAHRFLREWGLPVNPDAAIAEFYNRERALSEYVIERRRLEETIARRRRFDINEEQRNAERQQAFEELRSLVAAYGGDASGDEGEVLGVAAYLMNDRKRVALERQQDIAEWGRFQEALAGRSLGEWRADAEDARWKAEQKKRTVDEWTAKAGGELRERKVIEAEDARVRELIERRKRFDQEQVRRFREREEAFEELRRVVVSYGEDSFGDDCEVLRVADGLVDRCERLAEERQQDIAEWGRFQEALAGRSLGEWRSCAANARREARNSRRKAKELTAGLERELLQSDDIHAVLERTDRQLRKARTEASRTAGQLEQIDADQVDVATAKAALDEAKGELERVQRLQATLDTASEYLQRAAERAHRLLAPKLEALMGEWIPIITQGRYVGALVDPETLEVRVRQADGTIREAALLSHGTAEQVYLLLRMILAQVLTDSYECCPILLDDPTVHADIDRKMEILEYLLQASECRQVILFTQDESVVRWTRQREDREEIRLIELAAR